MNVPKPQRKVDTDLVESMYNRKCCICGSTPCDPSHIKSRGSGGPDTEWNVYPMCRKHHSEWHSLGWWTFLKKYPKFSSQLRKDGWMVNERELSLWNPKIQARSKRYY